jgi:hypothetical protein
MKDATLRTVVFGTLLGLAMSAHAQQSTDATKSQASAPAATTAPTSTPAVAAPDAPAASATPAATAPPVVIARTAMATSTSSAPDSPSADLLKAAREDGFHTRVKKGAVLFCKYDANIGTRLKTEKCFDENTMEIILEREQLQRDQLTHLPCLGGGVCGGVH